MKLTLIALAILVLAWLSPLPVPPLPKHAPLSGPVESLVPTVTPTVEVGR